MKVLLTLALVFSSSFAMADWEERQKQNRAEKIFDASTTAQAIKNNKFFKKWPTEYFADVGRSSLTHDDCIANGKYYGGFTVKCVQYEDVWENEEGDGEPGEWKKECVENKRFWLIKPASQAPSSVVVKFYRKVTGADTLEQTSSEYYLGQREVAIPACK